MTVAARGIAPETARHLDAVPEICRRYHVVSLDLFGSATRDDFHPERSDVDVLAKFHWGQEGDAFQTFFGMTEELETLFGRPVDLVSDGTITNAYILPNIEASRVRVFP